MKILAIETSCDETSASVVESDGNGVKILSNVVATSMEMHSKTGGIIPENAAREQVKYIIPVIAEALQKAGLSPVIPSEAEGSPKNEISPRAPLGRNDNVPTIDAIAVTYGPGLIGSLLVGVETAKTLSYLWDKPLIPVNHLFGHVYANWLEQPHPVIPAKAGIQEKNWIPDQVGDDKFIAPEFPLIALIVSGGHTDLLLMKSHTDITWLGGTRDDAAGECYDKSGRLLGLSYPAGPEIEKKALLGNPKVYHFPRPILHEKNYDFSFSGLKTAILREVTRLRHPGLDPGSIDSRLRGNDITDQQTNDICRGLQDAIIDVLINKTLKAAEEYNVASILLSGGVAANTTLRDEFIVRGSSFVDKIFVPQKSLCTDNAAMIGAAAIFQNRTLPWQEVVANPELYFD